MDVIIIGSGPAGMSAAVYATRAGLKVCMIEKSPISGGQVLNTYEVDNYLGMPGMNGIDMSMKFREHVDKLGVEVLEADVLSIKKEGDTFLIETSKKQLQSKSVIVATGAEHAKLGVPGEEELAGMGVSYCATCDGAFFRNRETAVVGGGDVALEDAIYLARGCSKVYLIHRRDSFRGAKVLETELRSLPNVELVLNTVVESIQGEDMVEKLCCKSVQDGSTMEIPVSGVFVAVGIHPQTELIRELVECDDAGYVIAGEDGATSLPGLFVAGDIRKKPVRQIITAVADGANAAVSAGNYCNGI